MILTVKCAMKICDIKNIRQTKLLDYRFRSFFCFTFGLGKVCMFHNHPLTMLGDIFVVAASPLTTMAVMLQAVNTCTA